MDADNNKQTKTRSNLLRYAALGTELLVILGIAVWGGLWLDEKTGLSPLFLIVLPLAGLVLVFVQLYRSLTRK